MKPARASGNTTLQAVRDAIVTCQACPRRRTYCLRVAREKKAAHRADVYWGKPVPGFGDPAARLLIVGLAPAAHGANRTGRMFTGDRSGLWLYRALHKAGLATQPISVNRDDPLRLIDCVITATCHCAPPDNKPLPEELANCRTWLDATFDLVRVRVLLALGQIAWRATVEQTCRREWYRGPIPKFSHGALVPLEGGRWLLGSFHPSQQNTFTGKLTEPMFDAIFAEASRLLKRDETAKS